MQTVFLADRLFDGTGAEPIEQAVLVVEDGRVVRVGRQGEVAEPPGAERVAYAGCTLVPGLIDGHVHLVFSASGNPLADLLVENDLALLARAVHNAQTALRAGVTTVKDLGGRGGVALALRDAIARGTVPGQSHPGGWCPDHHLGRPLLLARRRGRWGGRDSQARAPVAPRRG